MNKIKAMITQVLQAPDVVPALAKYIASAVPNANEKDVLASIQKSAGGIEGKEFVRKFYSAEKVDVVEDERAVVGVINTKQKDRDREIVDPDGAVLTDYQQNRVVLYAHDYSGLPIGRNMWIKKKPGVGLVAKTEFAKRPPDRPDVQPWLADDVYYLMKEKFINMFSVGFIPLEMREPDEVERKDGVERVITKWLMLEYSVVPVGSNPGACQLAAKSGAITDQKLISDLEIEIEEESKMTTEKETPKEEKVTVEIAERGIWAELTDDGPQFYFDEEVYTDADSKAWIMTFGEQVKDILEDEVIKGEDGLPDPELLKEALAKLDMEQSEGEIEIELEEKETFACECIECGHQMDIEGHCKDTPCPECGGTMRRADRPGPGEPKAEEGDDTEKEETGEDKGEDGAEAEGPAEEKSPEPEAVEDGMVELVREIKSLREEMTEMKEGRVLSKSTRSLVEQAISALQELLEKADSRAVTEEPEEEEKDIEIEVEEKSPAEEEPVTKEQIQELLNQPDVAAHIKGLMAKHTGRM